MKKADGAKHLRRLLAYGILDTEVLNISVRSKKPVIDMAERLKQEADEWGLKLGKSFMTQAEKYQADLDAAITDLKKPADAPAKKGKKQS